jgi:anti-sigma regulatory factor (Ser/Thr protein kinase)
VPKRVAGTPGRYRASIESRLSLPSEPSSAGLARRFVRDVLAGWGADGYDDRAMLLTSELVTNAVLHAHSAPEVVVRLDGDLLWIGVFDGIPLAPVRKRYGPEAATGRGLLLLERMAAAWGSESSGAGKVVWFELRPDGTGGAGGPAAASVLVDLSADLFDAVDDTPTGRSAHRRSRRAAPRPSPRHLRARRTRAPRR